MTLASSGRHGSGHGRRVFCRKRLPVLGCKRLRPSTQACALICSVRRPARSGNAWLLALAASAFGITAAQATTSSITDAFVLGTAPIYATLQRADALAETNAASPRLRAHGRRDLASQYAADAELLAWARGEQAADYAAAHQRTLDMLGPVFYPFDAKILPLVIHGRSETEPYRRLLAELAATQGQAFDQAYRQGAVAVTRRLIELYTDYIENGDDPGLRELSVRNLPKAKRLLAELERG